MEISVQIEAITKEYDSLVAVDRLSLDVYQGEFLSFLGPSGCGKTTTLRMIAGFIEPDAGRIAIMGQEMTFQPPHKRNLGMVFQSYALFPHMTVFDNVAFGLKMRKIRREHIKQRVARALDLVQLGQLHHRYPRQLSGGQQQRVALARAIVIEPYVLLLDEPLSNLDAKLRKTMQSELRDLQQRLGITTIYVTHDQEEALTISDRIVVMNEGRIMQIGSPTEIYQRPANEFVAAFIGKVNLLKGRVERADGNWLFISEQGFSVTIPKVPPLGASSDVIELVIRPEMLSLCSHDSNVLGNGVFVGQIVRVTYTGAMTSYDVAVGSGPPLLIEEQNRPASQQWQVGERVNVVLAPEAIYAVPPTGYGWDEKDHPSN